MKAKVLPKKYQGEFDWAIAAQAVNAGYAIQKWAYDRWLDITFGTVSKHNKYRIKPREFAEGWYEYKDVKGGLVYFTGDYWYTVGQRMMIRIDESKVGKKIK